MQRIYLTLIIEVLNKARDTALKAEVKVFDVFLIAGIVKYDSKSSI